MIENLAKDTLEGQPAEANRIERTLRRIRAMLKSHRRLGTYATRLQVSIENATVILQGELPSDELRRELVPTIRRAGVLWRVQNRVDVA